MNKVLSLQSLRYVFLLLIFMSHFSYGEVQALYGGGDCGVCFFFILSGFVLSLGYGKKVEERTFSHFRFLGKRLRKIYPIHLLLLLSLATYYYLQGKEILSLPLLANLFLVQSWIPDPTFFFSGNSVAWFLSDLLFFYLVFPFAYRLIYRLQAGKLFLLSFFLLAVYISFALLLQEEMVLPFLYIFPLTRLIDFCIGISISRLFLWLKICREGKRRKEMGTLHATLIELTMTIGLITLFLIDPYIDSRLGTTILFWLWIPFFIVGFSLLDKEKGLVTRLLHQPALLWSGSISFEFYMVHQMVIQGVMIYLIKTQAMPSYPIVLVICITASLLLAAGIHWLFRRITLS